MGRRASCCASAGLEAGRRLRPASPTRPSASASAARSWACRRGTRCDERPRRARSLGCARRGFGAGRQGSPSPVPLPRHHGNSPRLSLRGARPAGRRVPALARAATRRCAWRRPTRAAARARWRSCTPARGSRAALRNSAGSRRLCPMRSLRGRAARASAAPRRSGARVERLAGATRRAAAAARRASTSRPTIGCATPPTRAWPRASRARAGTLRLRPAGALQSRALGRRARASPRRAASPRPCSSAIVPAARAGLLDPARPWIAARRHRLERQRLEPEAGDAPPAPARQPVGLRARTATATRRSSRGARATSRLAAAARTSSPHSGPFAAASTCPPRCRWRAAIDAAEARAVFAEALSPARPSSRCCRRARARPARGASARIAPTLGVGVRGGVLHVLLHARQPDQGRLGAGAAVPQPGPRPARRRPACPPPAWGVLT